MITPAPQPTPASPGNETIGQIKHLVGDRPWGRLDVARGFARRAFETIERGIKIPDDKRFETVQSECLAALILEEHGQELQMAVRHRDAAATPAERDARQKGVMTAFYAMRNRVEGSIEAAIPPDPAKRQF